MDIQARRYQRLVDLLDRSKPLAIFFSLRMHAPHRTLPNTFHRAPSLDFLPFVIRWLRRVLYMLNVIKVEGRLQTVMLCDVVCHDALVRLDEVVRRYYGKKQREMV